MDAIQARKKIKAFATRNRYHVNFQFIRDDPDGVLIDDVGETGMVNEIYRVRSQDGHQSVIIKYGEEKARMVDLIFPLERQDMEYNALELFNSIYPGSVPQPYCFDKDLHNMAMEDLSHMKLFGEYYKEASIEVKHGTMLGEILAKIHNHTHKMFIDEEKWKELSSKFRLEAMRAQARDCCLMNQFEENHIQNVIPEECLDTYRHCIHRIKAAKLPEKLLEAFYKDECIIHNDLHESSLFVSSDRVVIFDVEFAGPGNPAFDIAYAVSNFVDWQYESSLCHPDKMEQIKKLTLMTMRAFVQSYLEGRKGIDTADDRRKFFCELKMFTGAKQFGTAIMKQAWMRLPPHQIKAMLLSSFALMMAHNDGSDWDDSIESLLWTGSSEA